MAMVLTGLCGVLAVTAFLALALMACAVRREEKESSLACEPPGMMARLARRIVGAHTHPAAAAILRAPDRFRSSKVREPQ